MLIQYHDNLTNLIIFELGAQDGFPQKPIILNAEVNSHWLIQLEGGYVS